MFTSCKKDVVEIPKHDISQNNNEILLSPPPCSPGSFSITNGSIKFTTLDDYKQTLHFFECADDSTKHAWIMNLPIEVAYTWIENFTDDIAAAASDSLDFINTWNDYVSNDLIDIEIDNGEEFSISKYPLYKAFIGASGYFMIDQALVTPTGL